MSRHYHPLSVNILKFLAVQNQPVSLSEIKTEIGAKLSAKDFYNFLFRLTAQDLVNKTGNAAQITADGRQLLARLLPEKDGVWKLVIFDIPEKHKYVRTVLRAKLRQLHFKKWQNSIWASPYVLGEEIEREFDDLGKKFFVRLVKAAEINHAEDLEKMFE